MRTTCARAIIASWFMACALWCGSPLVASVQGQNPQPANDTHPPNILIFLVDDLGWQDVSLPLHTEMTANNRWFRTPNVERLASHGMRFTNAYASSPVCSPTRTAILTGKNPARTNITNWIGAPGSNADAKPENQRLLLPTWNTRGLDSTDVTLPRLLKSRGYVTWHIGKAHFGLRGTEGADPTNLGFDVNIAGHAAGHPASYYGENEYGRKSATHQVPGLEEFHGTDTYLNDALTNKAIALIRRHLQEDADTPFFLHFAHYAVHTPIQGDPSRRDHYEDSGRSDAAIDYATMVESMDASLGRVLDELESHGILGRTVVIFTSDNGGLATHAGPPTTNAPLRSGKGSAYEGGTRVPLVIHWPDRTRANGVSHAIVSTDDLFPTVLAMAGVTIDDDEAVDGIDLGPLLDERKGISDWADLSLERVLVWHYPHYWAWPGLRKQRQWGVGPFSSIRSGDWKLIYFYDEGRFELYNLRADIGESNDLIETHPDRAADLRQRLADWLDTRDALYPVDRHTGTSKVIPPVSDGP